MSKAILWVLAGLVCVAARGQTIDDGIMMGKGLLCGGYLYTHDSWSTYWEGTRERTNGNIGTITTQSRQMFANYGISNTVNVIAHIPHVGTEASRGVLASMRGFQDATFAAKYRFFDTPFTRAGKLRAFAVVQASTPMTDYTPDFQPLSIGLGSRRIGARLTGHFRANRGWFINATAAHHWRDGVTLDRPYFYTDGKLTFSDRVPMPRVFEYGFSSGYIRGELVLSGGYTEQRTQGGGDIRRQDMPFVSNRMNFSRVGVWAKIPVAMRDALSIVGGYSYVVNGRNVGQSTTITAGVMYLLAFPWSRRTR